MRITPGAVTSFANCLDVNCVTEYVVEYVMH